MKRIIFLVMILSGVVFSQNILRSDRESGQQIGNGAIFNDSLRTWKDSTVAEDSSKFYMINYNYSDLGITVNDTLSGAIGATITDSLKAYKGFFRYDEDNQPVDTIWTTEALTVKSNALDETTLDSVMVGAGKIKSYTILENNIMLLKITRVNETVVEGVKTDITIEAKKEK